MRTMRVMGVVLALALFGLAPLALAQAQPPVVPVIALPPPDGDDGAFPEFLFQRFVPLGDDDDEAARFDLPKGAVVGMNGGCPTEGWTALTDDKGKLLYFPFGLIVDEDGKPQVATYALLSACEKQ